MPTERGVEGLIAEGDLRKLIGAAILEAKKSGQRRDTNEFLDKFAKLDPAITALYQSLAALQQSREAAERDAERYNELRITPQSPVSERPRVMVAGFIGNYLSGYRVLNGAELDEALDAARGSR